MNTNVQMWENEVTDLKRELGEAKRALDGLRFAVRDLISSVANGPDGCQKCRSFPATKSLGVDLAYLVCDGCAMDSASDLPEAAVWRKLLNELEPPAVPVLRPAHAPRYPSVKEQIENAMAMLSVEDTSASSVALVFHWADTMAREMPERWDIMVAVAEHPNCPADILRTCLSMRNWAALSRESSIGYSRTAIAAEASMKRRGIPEVPQ